MISSAKLKISSTPNDALGIQNPKWKFWRCVPECSLLTEHFRRYEDYDCEHASHVFVPLKKKSEGINVLRSCSCIEIELRNVDLYERSTTHVYFASWNRGLRNTLFLSLVSLSTSLSLYLHVVYVYVDSVYETKFFTSVS